MYSIPSFIPNTAVFKIYDNSGPDSIKHFEFAFGLDRGQQIYDSKANIIWDETWDGIQSVTLHDPENTLENVNVTTIQAPCNDDGTPICRIITVHHTFRAPLEFDIVGTQVWDYKRNSWQNYYNHGIHIEGDSINPAKQYQGIDKGHIYHLIQTEKNSAIDEFDESWTFSHGIWNKDYIKNEPIPSLSSILTREHTSFPEWKITQANNAIPHLLELCPTCLDNYIDFKPAYSLEFSERVSRSDNIYLQEQIKIQADMAKQLLE